MPCLVWCDRAPVLVATDQSTAVRMLEEAPGAMNEFVWFDLARAGEREQTAVRVSAVTSVSKYHD